MIISASAVKRIFILLLFVPILFYAVSCDSGGGSSNGGDGGDGGGEPQTEITFVNAFPELTFLRPLGLENAGDGSDRLFIVEQGGLIHVILPENTIQQGTERDVSARAEATVFLDLTDRIFIDNDGEVGLLGLAFHPDFENNGYFYVNYIADPPLRTVVSRFSVSDSDPNLGDPESELILLEIDQINFFHNGGQLFFGPSDGYLYITSGDGGPSNEGEQGVSTESQDRSNLFGAVLRIDVDNPDGELNYSIPPDNPFAGNISGFREEIYAYGLRNAWRASIDPVTGLLLAADVGQQRREEINIIKPGGNYGWHIMEGTLCFDPMIGCNTAGLEMPVWEYGRELGRSITGGFIYRGQIQDLQGKYIYGDFASGRVWALSLDGETVTDNEEIFRFPGDESFLIATFGLDEDGEIYMPGLADGVVYKLVEQEVMP